MTIIERPLTKEEREDMLPINLIDCRRKFMKKIADQELKCCEALQPFCRKCAYMEFDRKVHVLEIDSVERGINPDHSSPEFMKLTEEVNMDTYTGPKYFDTIGTSKITENILIDMNKTPVHRANFAYMECRKFKHPFTLRVEVDKWVAWDAEFKKGVRK